MEKRPIINTLRSMEVGATERFPLTQYNSVRTSVYTGLLSERADGMEWDIKCDLPGKAVIVTRAK